MRKYELVTHHFNKTKHNAPSKIYGVDLTMQLWLCAIAVSMIGSFKIIAWKNQISSDVYAKADKVKQYLQLAKRNAVVGNWEESKQNLLMGKLELRKLQAETIPSGTSWIPGMKSLQKLSISGEKILSGIEEVAVNISSDNQGSSPRGVVPIKSLGPTVAAAYSAISEANNASLYAQSILRIIPGKQGIESDLEKAIQTTGLSAQVLDLLNEISNRKLSVLLVMQNNNELRPTGGFFGTFGTMTLEKGEVTDLRVSSIYDLDGQLEQKQKVQPPLPLLMVNKQWLMRDSNWFADFPTSAHLINQMGETAGLPKHDLVVALTPEVVIKMLEITGPLDMPSYGITLDANNFVELTQLQTSLAYDKIENKPKELLADALPLLLTRMLKTDDRLLDKKVLAISSTLKSKDVLIYSSHRDIQDKIERLGWSGTIKSGNRDYLNIIRTNLSGTKTDRYIKQSSKLESTIQPNGRVVNKLEIELSNPLPSSDLSLNTSFIRILVPKNSKLIQATGFESPDLESVRAILDNPLHKQTQEWESGMVKELNSDTLIGTESGKTYFGNWVTLEGGSRKVIGFTYELPFTLGGEDYLSLIRQTQSGLLEESFLYSISHQDWIAKFTTQGSNSPTKEKTTWSLPLREDSVAGIVLVKD